MSNTISSNALLQMRMDVLTQNTALQRAVGGGAAAGAGVGAAAPPANFGDALTGAVKAVSAQQEQAGQAAAAYERGETHDLVGVMLARQKASLGFETTLQVRNKLLSAYRDIMNMPV